MKLLRSIFQRRGFAERPTSKKVAAMKKLQNEAKVEAPLVEIKLPAVGESLRNVNISVGKPDPILQPDSSYPEWIWSARGPCRAALRSSAVEVGNVDSSSSVNEEFEQLAKLKKYLRTENRKAIRRNNSILKAANQ